MSFQDELNEVTQTPESIQSKKDKESYAYGVKLAHRAHQEIKNELLKCAKEGKYVEHNSKKQITYRYDNDYFLKNDIIELKIRDISINKSLFNRNGEAAHEGYFDIKDRITFDAYMETLQKLCKNDDISIKFKIIYDSLRGERTYNINEKIIDYLLYPKDIHMYILCAVGY